MTKILTIDSDEAVVKRIVKILESNNYQAQSATTWTEAVDAIANGQPDLVLLNLEMPIIHGDVLLEFIREEGFEMPVIVVSFPVEEAEAKALREHGVFSIVEKPFEDESLIEEIERVIDIAEFAKEIESDTSADAEEPSDTTDAEEPSSDSTSESVTTDAEEPSSDSTSESATTDAEEPSSDSTSESVTTDAEEPSSDSTSESATTDAEEPSSDSTSESVTTDAEEPSSDSTSESASDDDEDKSATFLKQPRDPRTAPRPNMSKRKKVILFSIIGFYVLIGGFIAAIYFTDEVPAFVDQILRNW